MCVCVTQHERKRNKRTQHVIAKEGEDGIILLDKKLRESTWALICVFGTNDD